MGETIQHEGKITNVIKSIYALHKEEYITITGGEAGQKDRAKEEISINEPKNLIKFSKDLLDSSKSQYYITLTGEAKFPENENLQGKFELFYNLASITVESPTKELDEKIKELIEKGFKKDFTSLLMSLVPSSLLDLLQSLDNL